MPGAGRDHTILIVDDQKRLRKGLSRSLGQEHFRTLTAASGEEALRLLEKKKVDLVITDLVMPGMDGMALVRKIRSSTQNIEVIIITAYGSAGSVEEAQELGVACYLAKPFDLADLKSKVNELLKIAHSNGALSSRRPLEADCLKERRLVPRSEGALLRRAVPYVSPRNILRNLGRAAKAISGLASAFPILQRNISPQRTRRTQRTARSTGTAERPERGRQPDPK